MKYLIDVNEERVAKYGTIVLTDISADPDQQFTIAAPGFKFKKLRKDEYAITINRLPDEETNLEGVTNEPDAKGKTGNNNGANGNGNRAQRRASKKASARKTTAKPKAKK